MNRNFWINQKPMISKENKEIKIVTIGGGTGSFAVLSELRRLKEEEGKNLKISAIVAMSDSGGSTGVLMDDYGVLPAGDVRQCLVALAPGESKFLRELFTYRYEKNDGFLGGHSFGNIFLSTIEKMADSFPKAVEEAEKILKTLGKIYPVTTDRNTLIVEKKSGEKIVSQDSINYANLLEVERVVSEKNIDGGDLSGAKRIFLKEKVNLNPKIPKIIQEADMVLVNPGSFFTSILPNFLVPGLIEELKKTKAKKIFTTNMVTEKGHTDNFTVLEFLRKMEKFVGFSNFDYVLYNNNHDIPEDVRERYEEEGKYFVKIDDDLDYKNVKFIGGDFLKKPRKDCINKNFIRYDAGKLLSEVLKII